MFTAIKNYVKAHLDHFMISIGVSIVISLITNVFLHHLPFFLHLFHVPTGLIHWLGY